MEDRWVQTLKCPSFWLAMSAFRHQHDSDPGSLGCKQHPPGKASPWVACMGAEPQRPALGAPAARDVARREGSWRRENRKGGVTFQPRWEEGRV